MGDEARAAGMKGRDSTDSATVTDCNNDNDDSSSSNNDNNNNDNNNSNSYLITVLLSEL